jgi:hypothetical protein
LTIYYRCVPMSRVLIATRTPGKKLKKITGRNYRSVIFFVCNQSLIGSSQK